MQKEIENIDDIKLLVNTFYDKVREDNLLAPIFNSIIQDRWNTHLEKMYKFWQTVLLDDHTYQGSPFAPHARLPVDKLHFDRWLTLFYDTINENFEGEKAQEALHRASNMARMFEYKIELFKSNKAPSML